MLQRDTPLHDRLSTGPIRARRTEACDTINLIAGRCPGSGGSRQCGPRKGQEQPVFLRADQLLCLVLDTVEDFRLVADAAADQGTVLLVQEALVRFIALS